MVENVPVKLVFYDSEPEIPVLGGPLYHGYKALIDGQEDRCRAIICSFLASVYASRPQEFFTERFVREICAERKIQMPGNRLHTQKVILDEAVIRRFNRYHLPIAKGLLTVGFMRAKTTEPITMTFRNGVYLLGDGKNRCSILAALGWESIPEVEVSR